MRSRCTIPWSWADFSALATSPAIAAVSRQSNRLPVRSIRSTCLSALAANTSTRTGWPASTGRSVATSDSIEATLCAASTTVSGRDATCSMRAGSVVRARPLAAQLDALQGGSEHAEALAMARARLADAALTPSARVLAAMKQDFGDSHVAFIRAQSEQTRQRLLALPWSEAQTDRYVRMAAESIAAQKAIEAADTLPFEAWREQYMAVKELG